MITENRTERKPINPGKKLLYYSFGLAAGLISGLLGAGGGALVVPALMKLGIKRKKAHATAIFAMLPTCALGFLTYYSKGYVGFKNVTPYAVLGGIGALVGVYFLQRIKVEILKKVFGILICILGARLILR